MRRAFWVVLVLAGLALCLACDGGGPGKAVRRAEAFVDVPGGRVWTETVNPDAPGVPLLVIHGGPGVPHDYLENLAALAVDRPVVFYDQLGCGRSDKPDDPGLWTVSRAEAELAAVRQALGLERVHLLGQSWGGALAAAYVLDTGGPGVESLILCAPLLSTPRWIADQKAWLARMPGDVRLAVERAEASGDFASDAYLKAMDAYYRRHLCRLDPWPENMLRSLQGMNANIYEHMWGPSEFTATGLLRSFDLTPRLGRISVPTLLVCGEFDEAAPGTMRFFSTRIPGSETAIIKDASHMHHLEQPKQFLNTINTFLTRQRPGTP